VQKASFEPLPQSAEAARNFLRGCLTGCDLGVDIDTILLLVTELVTNAILHTGLSFDVTVELSMNCIHVCANDLSAVLPAPSSAADDEISGRGLAIIEALADRWGFNATDLGKRVWFELDTPVR
jgi:anti-sigma regulatory factor (Ser/Thr protein kinase)